jgi:hypothetical protein
MRMIPKLARPQWVPIDRHVTGGGVDWIDVARKESQLRGHSRIAGFGLQERVLRITCKMAHARA